MSLQLEPSHLLSFERPLTRMVENHLTLENTGSEPIIFKVKTTAPKLYCVRPNVGRVEPHSKVQVEVYLQAFKQEPPLDKPCKDKFLILSATVNPSDAMTDLHATWSRIESTEKSRINQTKLRCEYRQPEGMAPAIQKQDQDSLEVSTTTADESSLPVAEESNEALEQARQQLKEMQQKLDAYQGEISHLRQRNINNNNDESPATTTFVKETRIESTGYPPYIVVLVALVAFIFAWLVLSLSSS
ncbi:VAMP-associated protein [Lichtheimia hyalospora FSU 10163]|nr:VAMP-associated protein [Lichtheimia hyalospora FSU 10163]